MSNTHTIEGHWKFQEGKGSQKPKNFKGNYEAKLKFQEG